MDVLDLTANEAQERINSSAGSPVDKITVGAAILRKSKDPKADTQILLLKRSAHEMYYPNMFEVPGGKVDPGESLRDAVKREVNEESGLVVFGIVKALPAFNYTTTKTADDPTIGTQESICRRAQQFSYVVTIEGDGSDFRVNQEEHSEGAWFEASDLANVSMTDEMRNLVIQALT
ncbi:NUDIX hydrolase [Sarocladium strictum]